MSHRAPPYSWRSGRYKVPSWTGRMNNSSASILPLRPASLLIWTPAPTRPLSSSWFPADQQAARRGGCLPSSKWKSLFYCNVESLRRHFIHPSLLRFHLPGTFHLHRKLLKTDSSLQRSSRTPSRPEQGVTSLFLLNMALKVLPHIWKAHAT